MSNFQLEYVPRWCPASIKIIHRELEMPKCGTWFVLWFALVKFFLAIQQNIEYFVRNWREFFNSVQITVNKSSVDTVARLGNFYFCITKYVPLNKMSYTNLLKNFYRGFLSEKVK
jgi:hypothetical protein